MSAAVAAHRSPPRPAPADARRAVNSSPARPSLSRRASTNPSDDRHDRYLDDDDDDEADAGPFPRVPPSLRGADPDDRPSRPAAAPDSTLHHHHPPVIKQERANSTEPPHKSPTPPARHRPRRLDLSSDKSSRSAAAATAAAGPAQPSAPLTGNAMHDVGIACLSPGFQTHDPAMRQQLQRSMDLREQQRRIIEQRQSQKDGASAGLVEPAMPSSTFARPPGSSKRKGPPANLNLQASTYSRFADERVVQSAPLHQSFTGLNRGAPHPLSRQVLDRSANADRAPPPPSSSSNRLPPIGDVFASQGADAPPRRPSETLSRQNSGQHNLPPPRSPAVYPPQPSPGFAPSHQRSPPRPPASAGLAPPPSRGRDFNSAEDAMRSLSGGREELMPKIVHYGGHQPPTPPSPLAPARQPSHLRPDEHPRRHSHAAYEPSAPTATRRRTRDEYERDYPEQRFGYDEERARQSRDGPFGAGRDSPETLRKKKEEFMWLCARAWDLFHS